MSTPDRAQSDFKKLKAKYNSQLSTLKELFSDWTEEDLLFTLQDADGDLELAIDRISEGHANQWGEVKTKKSKKEAAAANKASLESSTSNTSTAAPSYPTSFNNRSTAYNSKPSVHQKSHQRPSTTAAPRHKPSSTSSSVAAVSWQSKKPSTSTTSNFSNDSWNTTTVDSWGSGGDAWKPKENTANATATSTSSSSNSNAWLEAPKKVTGTSSSSTKSSNAGVAKTWASLLQTKEEPIQEVEPVSSGKETEYKLKKVEDSWLTPATTTNNTSTTVVDSISQWDQPIQLPVKEVEEKPVEDKKDDISVNFSSLNLEENVPKANASSSHPSVADILNSVKQQPQTSTTTSTTNAANSSSIHDNTNVQSVSEHIPEPQSTQKLDNQSHQQQALYQQQQHQYQQQQQYQQQSYQQFGMQDYSNSFNANYGAYGNERSGNYYNSQPQKFATDIKQDAGTKSGLEGQQQQQQQQDSQFPQMYNNNMQQQSFYPYYYMPNQFNAYSPYGQHQQAANSFMGGRNNMYSNSVYGQQQPKTMGTPTTSTTASAAISSPYTSSSPYNPSQQLYGGGFNSTSQFDDFSSNQFYGQQQFLNNPQQPQQPQQQEGGSPEKTNKSPQNQQQQAYGSNYFGQSPMFSYQQQQYRGGNSSQQYWNQ